MAKQERKEAAEDQTGKASSAQSNLRISGNETRKRNKIREKRANLGEDDGFFFKSQDNQHYNTRRQTNKR